MLKIVRSVDYINRDDRSTLCKTCFKIIYRFCSP